MIKEFKEFIARGNVIDLAVAVVIGAAFGVVVKGFTENILTPIIGIVGGKPDFDKAYIWTVNGSDIKFGAFLTTALNFLIVAFALFLVVKAVNKMTTFRRTSEVAEDIVETQVTEIEVLTQIRDLLVAQNHPPT